MKKLFVLLVAAVMLSVQSASVFAASADEDLAKLVAELGGTAEAEAPELDDSPAALEPTAPAPEEHNAAEDILGGMDSNKWTYAGEEKIEVQDVEETRASLVLTQVKYDGQPVTKYKVYYSDKTLATVQDFAKINQVIVDVMKTDGNMVTLDFKDLSANQTYYVVVAPVHPTDATQEPLSFISDEVMFTTKEAITAPAPTTKVFENVSYTYKDSLVTLTWTPTAAASSSEIHLRHQSEAAYTKIGSPTINDGKFSFTVTKQGTFFLKMVALDAAGAPIGQEHIQTIKIDEVQQPATVVQAAPQVGATTNIIIGLMIFSVFAYLATRFRRIER